MSPLWTPERIGELERLLAHGISAAKIGSLLGVSKSAVLGKKNRLGLCGAVPSGKRWTSKEDRKLRGLVGKNLTWPQIGKSLDRSAVACMQRWHNYVSKRSSPSNLISLADLPPLGCRYPYGDPGDDDFGFCGKRAATGSTYCPEHRAICHIKIQPRKSEAA